MVRRTIQLMLRVSLKPLLAICTLCAWTSASAEVFTVSSTDVPKAIPDFNGLGVRSFLSIPNSGTITDVNLTLNITHTSVADLFVGIIPPGSASVVQLITVNGIFSLGGGLLRRVANFSNTTIDDQSASNLANANAPFTGTFNVNHASVGNNPLAALNGRNALGQWTLVVADLIQADTGTINSWSLTITTSGAPGGLRFVPTTPCRLIDTRENRGSFGTPALVANAARSFTLPSANCGIPANASAYSLNVTVVPKEPLGFITIWPTGTSQPFVSTLNSLDGRVKANAALVPAGTSGAISVYATNPTELIVDINGYFIDPSLNAQSLAFYPVTPCRVADTRNPNGSLGGPIINAGASRDFPILSSNCGIPANAQAFSLNATVVPIGPLGFLTLWLAGQGQPFVSTLNAPTGAIVANAAIVPSGTNGTVSAFMSGQSHLVLDINGYFAPAGAANAQRFFTVTPCRLIDTRLAAGEFGGPVLASGATRGFRLPLASCGLPAGAAAFSLNATVVPTVTLGFLTLFPTGTQQPFVSTLNAPDDTIVANAALVPAGTAGSVTTFVNNQTHLIMDTNGYFAP